MTTPDSTYEASDEKTVIGRRCPRCKAINALEQLPQQGYACRQCGFELAYLDYTATGGVRDVLGWVRNAGDVIHDRYKVREVLGRGGFGSTYLVDDLRLNGRRRALKEIPPNMFDDQEPMLLAKLDHPGIPDITDRFEHEGLICMVLEFGGTQTMESKRKEFGGKIPLSQLLPWMNQLCDVLDYLHTRTPPIIHRDLKPGNILLDENERIRLIDFGIAKVVTPSEATHTLGRAVSYGFSSPEQVTGSGTDHRSDIYGLGATVYFLLSGVHPPNITERLSDKTVKRLADLAPGIPPELDRAVAQSLELNADKRQQSVKELWNVFEKLSPHAKSHGAKPAGVKPAEQTKNNALMILAGLLVLAALMAVGVYFFWQKEVTDKQAEVTPPERRVEPGPTPSPAEPAPVLMGGEPERKAEPLPPPEIQPEKQAEKAVPPPPKPVETEPAAPKGPPPAPPAVDVAAPAIPPPVPPAQPAAPAPATVLPPAEIPAPAVPLKPPPDITPPAPPEAPPLAAPAPSPPADAVEVKKTPTPPPATMEKKKPGQQAATPPKKDKPAPAAPPAPVPPPAREKKPEADWGGSMQWLENRPKSP